jgi:hypothetical protein
VPRSALRHTVLATFVVGITLAGASPYHRANATTIYADTVDASFEKEDAVSEATGHFKCELNLALLKLPNSVNLRIKMLRHDKNYYMAATVDAVEFTISNGIPFNPKRIPIVSPSIASNMFETTPQMPQVDMHDGGFGIAVTPEQFGRLSALIVRGDYFVTYVPKGSSERVIWAIHDGVNAKVFGEYTDCIKKMN